MPIRSVCQTDVVTITKNSTLKEASQLMQKQHVGSLIVTENYNGKRIPSGIITDRDLALAMGFSDKVQDLKVENIMHSHPITVSTSEGIFQTVAKMRKNGVKRLPVVDEIGSLYGVICADDLLSLMGEEINNLANISETQIKKEQSLRMPSEKQVST